MKIKLLSIVAIFLMSCGASSNKANNAKQKGTIIHDMSVDFPKTDTLEISKVQEFDILPQIYRAHVRDTVLFALEKSTEYVGHCYSINSGKLLSVMANIGRARNEIDDFGQLWQIMSGDSIQFMEQNQRTVKVFAINDILTLPAGDRKNSVWNLVADNVWVSYVKKLDNGLMFGYGALKDSYDSFYTYDGKECHTFGKMPDDVFEPSKDVPDRSSQLYAMSKMAFKGDFVVLGHMSGIAISILNTATREVVKSRFYNKYVSQQSDDPADFSAKSTTENYNSWCGDIVCNDKYIYAIAVEEIIEKRERRYIKHLCIYDWELNPIKRYAVRNSKSIYFISTDCTTLYTLEDNGDKKVLYGGKIEV